MRGKRRRGAGTTGMGRKAGQKEAGREMKKAMLRLGDGGR